MPVITVALIIRLVEFSLVSVFNAQCAYLGINASYTELAYEVTADVALKMLRFPNYGLIAWWASHSFLQTLRENHPLRCGTASF